MGARLEVIRGEAGLIVEVGIQHEVAAKHNHFDKISKINILHHHTASTIYPMCWI